MRFHLCLKRLCLNLTFSGACKQLLSINLCEELGPKQQKGLIMVEESDAKSNESNTLPLSAFSSSIESHNWWDLGDARRLFAPASPASTMLYNTACRVKEIVLEKIELLESVN